MSPRSALTENPSVAGYTASTRPPAVPVAESSAPRFTNSRALERAPVEEPHGPGNQQNVTLLDHAVEKRLARPRRLDHPVASCTTT